MNQPNLDHQLRASLAHELHARPFLGIGGSVALTHLAIYTEGDTTNHEAILRSLCELTDLAEPTEGTTHYTARWNNGRQLKWEKHTEFSTFTFVADRHDSDFFSGLATEHVPPEWLHTIEGKRLVAVRMELASGEAALAASANMDQWIDTSGMVGSNVMGDGQVYCDWTIKPDGYSRFLVIDNGLRAAQGGRLLQRLYEIESYRMMALLALPVARDLGKSLDELQLSITALMHSMDLCHETHHHTELLSQLTHLAVEVEVLAGLGGRFSASRAYEGLVLARIRELREVRIEGMPTIDQFLDRRFGPAMDTCRAVWQRHEQVASRVARAIDLLRTRVHLAQEEDTTRLLEGMNQTARSQLRLQHAVEGLSVAAISYYVLSLSSAALKALNAASFELNSELIVGILIIPIVVLVLLATRYTKSSGSDTNPGSKPKAMKSGITDPD
ncbi:MAG: DUF3422 domain-containing protein [Burkholderiaceae bacterium]|nr:DUF3422 domain-containing protein [Burkholderiaceae bacterium]